MLKNIFNSILDMVYPPTCIGCNGAIPHNKNILCIDCINNLPFTNFSNSYSNPTAEKFYGRVKIENAYSLLFFTKDSVVQHLMHALKYQNNKSIGHFLGTLLADRLAKNEWIADVDMVIPLPLHKKRLQKRGYNQSAIISGGFCSQLSIPVNTDCVVRNVNTDTQTGKTREERWRTMQNVFSVTNADILANKHVLLIDDTITTGATLEACGTEILKINNTKLSIATIAFVL